LNKRRSTRNSSAERQRGLTVIVRVDRRHRDDFIALDEQRGLYVPRYFEAGFLQGQSREQPAVWLEMGTGVPKGEPPEVQSIRIISRRSHGGISAEQFHRVQYATFRRIAVAAAAGTREELTSWMESETETGRVQGGDIEQWRERKVIFNDLARRPVGRPRLEELVDLAEVVRVAGLGSPKSTKAVMDHFHVSRSTAQRWLQRARATDVA
jgi:hypothetical protein